MSVWTAMDIGTPPQWMLPRVSFRAMLYLGFEQIISIKETLLYLQSLSGFVQCLLTHLKSSPMPPYSTGLFTPRRPASPSFLNTLNILDLAVNQNNHSFFHGRGVLILTLSIHPCNRRVNSNTHPPPRTPKVCNTGPRVCNFHYTS